jgi:hypothetical protein
MLDGSLSLVVGGRAMRDVALWLVVSTTVGWSLGCAETSACPPGQRQVSGVCAPEPQPCKENVPVTKELPIACVVDPQLPGGAEAVVLAWELTAELLDAIEPGDPFEVRFRGKMSFGADVLNDGLRLLGEFSRASVPNAEARVQVRAGARPVLEDADIVLKADVPKTCTYDEEGDRGANAGPFPSCEDNDDCVGGGPVPPNDCLPYVNMPIEMNCSVCAELGAADVCDLYGFCVAEAVEIPLLPEIGFFRADESGTVFFGYADDLDVESFGVDRGAFLLSEERRAFGEDIRRSGADTEIWPSELGGSSVGAGWECVTAVASRGPDGPSTTHVGASPAPSGMLISCPIPGSDR